MRFLEKLPAYISWTILTIPFWGAFIAPVTVAYFIILFDIYFFWKAATLGINSVRGYLLIKKESSRFWLKMMRQEKLNYSKIRHVIFIPTYKEPEDILDRTLRFLSEQEFPTKQLSICLGLEERDELAEKKSRKLKEIYSKYFENFWITIHPLISGELAGKSSNLAYSGRKVKGFIDEKGYDKDFILATSCDADVAIHPKYFSDLTYKFLKNPARYTTFWQGALVFYNNIWRVPMFVRMVHTIYSINNIAELLRPASNFNFSTYSMSWNLLEKADFWDVDVVAEDWHFFFKSFFSHEGKVELESIFLPLFADAAE